MIRPVNNKKYTNAHPIFERIIGEKVEPERIELAGKTFSMSKYKKYEEIIKKGLNLKKLMPNVPMSELKEFYRLYQKRNPND